MHERHRHAFPVLGGREHKARHIGRRVETARYRLPLDEGSRALAAVVVVEFLRPGKRRGAEADDRSREFVDGLQFERVGLLLERDLVDSPLFKLVTERAAGSSRASRARECP